MKKYLHISVFLFACLAVSAQSLSINFNNINPSGWPLVRDIKYDQDSTIWACDESGGLFYKTKTSATFEKFITPVIGSSDIRAVSAVSVNDIWISVNNHGLFHYNGTDWTKFDTSNGLPAIDNWRSIERDKKGNIWFGNFGNGIARYNGTSWQFYNTNNSGLKSNSIFKLVIDDDDKVLAGASEYLMILNGSTWTSRNLDSEFGFRTWINGFFKDDFGKIWIPTDTGVLVYDNGEIVSMKNELGERDYQSMAVDKKGVIWLAETFEGLWRFNNNQGRKFTVNDDPKVPTQAWKMLISVDNEKLMIGNRSSNLIVINDDAFSSSTIFLDGGSFEMYPNPITDQLFVKTDKHIVQYRLFDLSGRLCKEKKFTERQDLIQISFDQVTSSTEILILQFTTKDGEVINQKVIIQ